MLAVLMAVLAGWLGDGLKGEALFCPWTGLDDAACRARGLHRWWIGGSAALLGLVVWGGRNILGRLRSIAELREVPFRPARQVIALLSKPNHARLKVEADAVLLELPGLAEHVRLSAEDPAAMLALKVPWNGLPLLHGLLPHAGTLEDVVLVASPESVAHVRETAAAIQALVRPPPRVAGAVAQPCFADPRAVREALHLEIHALRKAKGRVPVVVNVTGGTKTASIAAAAAAVDHDLLFEYVEEGQLRVYRIRSERWMPR